MGVARNLECFGVNVCWVQVTTCSNRVSEYILCKGFQLYSPCFDGCSEGVSLLVSKSLDAAYALVFVETADWFCVLDIILKE